MQEATGGTAGAADGVAVAAFLGYLALVVGIGLAATRFSSGGVREFFLAGRRLDRVVVALSAVVSGRSAWLLLGFSDVERQLRLLELRGRGQRGCHLVEQSSRAERIETKGTL